MKDYFYPINKTLVTIRDDDSESLKNKDEKILIANQGYDTQGTPEDIVFKSFLQTSYLVFTASMHRNAPAGIQTVSEKEFLDFKIKCVERLKREIFEVKSPF